jgi:AraC-like DNA-binding protein
VTNTLNKESKQLDTLLADATAASRATSAAVVSTMPGGALRITRPATTGTLLNRIYSQSAQYVDGVSWAAILTGKPVLSTDYLARHPEARQSYQSGWLAKFGFSSAVAVPLAAPVLPGFPGALIAMRGVGQPDFTSREVDTLVEAASSIDRAHNDRMGPIQSTPSLRIFVANDQGRFLGRTPTAVGIDPALANGIDSLIAERLKGKVDPNANTGGERVSLADSHGANHPFRVLAFDEYPALSTGRVVIVAKVPFWSEWLHLTPEDFSADEEVARLLPAFKYMADHYAEGITLKHIAKSVHLSPFHFHRRFTQQLGITPKHFLYDCQIAKAEELLMSSSHELEQIAKLCGFAHQSHFTSRFKQATGLTPTRWRRMKMSLARPAGSKREM